jgi:F-box/TPR repeat protein Pof3
MVSMALDRIGANDTKRRVDLSKLKGGVLEMQKQLDEHNRRLQYHFGKLPTEIFAEVFRLLIIRDQTQLLTLLHVCKRWRDIVWHTPMLWDTLVVTHRNPTRKVALWTKRSNGGIRELRVRGEVLLDLDWSFDSLRDLKWDRLRICAVEAWDIAQYLDSISMTHILANLEEFQVNYTLAPFLHGDTLFPANSRLRALTMDHCRFSWSALSAHLKNLIYMAIHSCDGGSEMFLALEANPNLETLIIKSSHRSSSSAFPRRRQLLLSRLTHLEVEGADASDIIEQLSFQNLQVLRICRVTRSLDLGLSDPSGRGLAGLTELCVCRCSVTPSIIIDLLQETVSLEILELSHLSYTVNQVIEALATPLPTSTDSALSVPTKSDGTAMRMICPSLARLDISHSPDIKTGPLVRLIRSRLSITTGSNDLVDSSPTPTVARILSLKVDGCPFIDPDWLPWLRKSVPIFSCVFMTKKNASWKR